MTALVQVQGVSLTLGKNTILKKISFEVVAGESLGVIGHNGAGKTTLFHILLGFKFQNSGDVFLFGQKAESPGARRRLGYVPERPYFQMEETLQSTLRYFGKLSGMSAENVDQKAESILTRFNLQNAYQKKLKNFSKGMLQKALLTQALLHDPELLILDEPMSGLDPESRDEVKRFLEEWKISGKTAIFSSHTLEDVALLATRVLKLSQGEVQP